MTGRRYGVISDVHGNLPALRVALDRLQAAGMDRLLCLGDVIGYGPYPVECTTLVASYDPVAVAGNHERVALGLLSDESCSSAARESLRWTTAVLTAEARARLAQWPLVATEPGLLLAHGSPQRVDEYVRTEARAGELLSELAAQRPTARVLLLGHTHQAWAFSAQRGTVLRERPGRVALDPAGPMLLNPGSVGQSRDRRAHVRCLTLDLDEATAEFHSVPYDVEECRRALRSHGLPPEWCHVVPPPLERLRGVVGDALRRAGLR